MPDLPLVTGATGFAGSHLVEHLLQDVPRVAAWANPSGTGTRDASRDARVEWCEVDLLDRAAVASAISALRPRAIYHCAGSAHVGDSFTEPERALRINVLGTHHLLDAVRAAGLACRVLVTGSAMVYRPALEAMREDQPIAPNSPYGVSKLAQEMLALREADFPVLLARPFNHAGPGQNPSYVTSSFAQQIARIEAGRRDDVLRVGNLDSRRDITDVRDTVRAYRLLVERGTPARPYNVCSGRAYRVGDLLEVLLGLAKRRVTVAADPARLRPSDNPIILGDYSRLAADTGWSPAIPIERTLEDLLDYWRARIAASS